MRRTAFQCPLKLVAATSGIVMRWRRGSEDRAKSAESVVSEIQSDRQGLLPEGAGLFYCLFPATVTYTGQPEKGIKSGDGGMFIEKCSKVFIVFMF